LRQISQLSSGLAVGHRTRGRAKAGVAGIYNRSLYTVEKRAALDLWAKPHSNPAGRRPPAETDRQKYFRVSPPSVHQMVLTLERAGFIRRQPRTARSIEVLVDQKQLPKLL